MGKERYFALFAAFFLLTIALALPGAAEEKEDDTNIIDRIAVLDTDFGIIKFVLYENWTPITTSNFIDLAVSGHYDGVLFHRIVDDFVIQTGDGGGTGDPIPLEIHPNATHIDGAVGMARSDDPDSAEDQFYICDGPQHGLDGDYAVFGLLIEGMEVVREIAQVPVYGENNPRPGEIIPALWYNVGMPKEDVYVNTVTIETPEMNETGTDDYSSGGVDLGASPLAWVVVVVVGVIVLWYVFRVRKWQIPFLKR